MSENLPEEQAATPEVSATELTEKTEALESEQAGQASEPEKAAEPAAQPEQVPQAEPAAEALHPTLQMLHDEAAKAGINPAQAIAIAKAVCSASVPVCAFVNGL